MYWICPLCGYQNDETSLRCLCGFQADEGFLKQSVKPKTADIFEGQEKTINIKEEESAEPMNENQNLSDNDIFIKEINSWKVIFSKENQCIYFSTPALQEFRLKLTLDDLKELIVFISEKAKVDIIPEKKLVSKNEIAEFVEILDKMIEVKRAKFKIKFSDDELQGIADILNKKLQK